MLHIANPIYDVVFKYLMEDQESACLLLSAILEEPVVELEFLPQEQVLEVTSPALTVYCMDFSARIRTGPDTFKQVVIKVQKAKFATDIMRFRRYLGDQYCNRDHVHVAADGQPHALPIVSIYLLGYSLEHTRAPVVQVKRHYYDARTRARIEQPEEFIESLTHDSYVIQVGALKEPYQTEVEHLLSIFDQHRATSGKHELQIDEEVYPAGYRPLLRRLVRASAERTVRMNMDLEDDILEELERLERKLETKEEQLREQGQQLQEQEEQLRAKEGQLQAKDGQLQEQEEQLRAKDGQLQEQEEQLRAKDHLIEELRAALLAQRDR